MNRAVSVRGLQFAHPGQAPVLQGLDLDIAEGEFLGILGPNGAGKSSLIQLLASILRPTAGSIDIMGHSPNQMRHRIGYVPQQPPPVRHLPITVSTLVELGCLQGWHPLGGARRADQERARAALAEVELTELAPRLLRELSGGELQRALLARALAAEPALLLLDEPTAHIDPAAESRIWAILRQMVPARTVVVVSHDPALLVAHADRIALLNGSLHVIAPDELDAPTLKWAYSRHPDMAPPTRALRVNRDRLF